MTSAPPLLAIEQRKDKPRRCCCLQTEQLMGWAEHVPLDRATDDGNGNRARAAADDMEQLAIARDGQAGAARIKFDLDLPSASVDGNRRSPRLRPLPGGTGSARSSRPTTAASSLMAPASAPFAQGLAFAARRARGAPPYRGAARRIALSNAA